MSLRNAFNVKMGQKRKWPWVYFNALVMVVFIRCYTFDLTQINGFGLLSKKQKSESLPHTDSGTPHPRGVKGGVGGGGCGKVKGRLSHKNNGDARRLA